MKLLKIAVLGLLLFVAPGAQATTGRHEPRKPFRTDGCTLFPNGNYLDCCVAHDYAYWRGGTLRDRFRADDALVACVWRKGKIDRFIAPIMWPGVRIGGVGWVPDPVRWGWSHRYPRSK
jgi:hypothetical protein